VKYLLDTHVWIWSQEDPKRLGGNSRRLLLDSAQEHFVSAISALEIARLIDRGFLRLKHQFAEWKELSLSQLQAGTTDVTHEIAWEAYNLPGKFHSDPADRVLVATARLNGFTLLTADDLILRYGHVKSVSALR
jgi:PIN domain nuclease of toxin-antitoxin system